MEVVHQAQCDTANLNYLDDVFGLKTNNNCPHISSWGCDAFSSSLDTCTNNLMGGNVSAGYLSPKQIGIMHRSLRVKSMRQKITNCPFSTTPLEITTNTTWDNDIYLYRDIILKNNSILTITCRVGLPKNGKIIVEKGSKLIVDGGTLTNNCKDSYWYGIQLNGDNAFDQFPLSQPTHQGKLVLKNNAILENANYTITFKGGGYGGLVEAENTTFRNSRRFVEFLKYPYINHSHFKRCTFINDTFLVNIHENTPLAMITLWDNKGVKFFGCSFKDETGINDYSLQNGNGIFSIDAGYKVLGYCKNSSYPCGNYDSSKFVNFNQGILALSSGSQKTIVIDHSQFVNNTMALSIKGTNNIRFTNNSILSGGLLKTNYHDIYQYGINFLNSTGYEVEGNSFKSQSNPVLDVVFVNVKESGMMANEIYRNKFKDHYFGQQFIGINRLNAFQGLQTLCNSNKGNNTETDIIVQISDEYNPYEGIRDNQGNGGVNAIAAGNTFSTSPAKYQIDNSFSQRVIQYFDINSKLPTILNGPILTTDVSSINSCFVKTTALDNKGDLPVNHVPWSKLDSVPYYYELLNNYNNLLYTYYQYIDNGNTDSLLSVINMTHSNESIQLRNDLIEQSPYLSEQILRDAASIGVLSHGQLLEICLANPDATQNEAFLEFLQFEIPNPLPSSMIQLIYQSWEEVTLRTLLEYQLSYLNADLGWRSNQILHYYYTDSLNHYDSIANLLKSRNNRESDYNIIEIAMEDNNYDIANSLLSQMYNTYEFDNTQSVEFSNFEDYISVRQTFYEEDKSIMSLNENDLDLLRNIADLNTGRSSVLAQNILCFGYNECSNEDIYLGIKNTSPKINYHFDKQSTTSYKNRSNKNVANIQKVIVSPNPTTNKLTIQIIGIDANSKVSFQLNNLGGQQVLNQRITANKTNVNLKNLNKGVYIYKIIVNGEINTIDKLIIQ